MDKKEFEDTRKELMKPGWTEDLHYGLKDLEQNDAKKIVESMDESEVWRKVNNRQFQEDYIADYLLYLWEISEIAFWKHIKTTFDDYAGMLWGSDMQHYEILCENDLPPDVFDAILKFTFANEKLNSQDEEAVFCIINAQVKKFDKLSTVKEYISNLDKKHKESAETKLENGINKKCNYLFG